MKRFKLFDDFGYIKSYNTRKNAKQAICAYAKAKLTESER